MPATSQSLIQQLREFLPAYLTQSNSAAPPMAPSPEPAAKQYNNSTRIGEMMRRRKRASGLMATLGSGGTGEMQSQMP